jgi:hypothetical protein
MGVMDDSLDRESYDHKGDFYQKHCIKVVTKLSGYCIDENRKKIHQLPAEGQTLDPAVKILRVSRSD